MVVKTNNRDEASPRRGYQRPVVQAEPMRLGVYGNYGCTDAGPGGPGDRHGGNDGGRQGGGRRGGGFW